MEPSVELASIRFACRVEVGNTDPAKKHRQHGADSVDGDIHPCLGCSFTEAGFELVGKVLERCVEAGGFRDDF